RTGCLDRSLRFPLLITPRCGQSWKRSSRKTFMVKPFLSVVVPCYNEEEVLPEFQRRMSNVCRDLGVSYEIVLINDGSTDGTWEAMLSMGRADPHVVCVNLSRNHGQALALHAGLSVCQGQRIL